MRQNDWHSFIPILSQNDFYDALIRKRLQEPKTFRSFLPPRKIDLQDWAASNTSKKMKYVVLINLCVKWGILPTDFRVNPEVLDSLSYPKTCLCPKTWYMSSCLFGRCLKNLCVKWSVTKWLSCASGGIGFRVNSSLSQPTAQKVIYKTDLHLMCPKTWNMSWCYLNLCVKWSTY